MTSILFICTGNMYRSPIAAEAFRNQLILDGRDAKWNASSAGTWTTDGRRAPNEVLELARAYGFNLDAHLTRVVTREILEEADVILTMEEGHKESIQAEFPFVKKKIHLLSEVAEGFAHDVPDPAQTPNETKNILRDLIAIIRAGCQNIYRLAEQGLS